MDDWQEVKLGDVCEVSSSKRIFAKEYLTNGIPFYRGKEIIEKHNGHDVSTELYISFERYEQIKQGFGVPNAGDILMTSVGTLGIPWVVNNERFYFKDGNVTWIKDFDTSIHNWFLYYWIHSPFGKKQISDKTIGSTQQALTIQAIKTFEIKLPPLPEQKAIAATLSCLDDMIELNNKTNKILEEMAQAIFKRWFVDFEFPDENGQPYKSSGGEMEESEHGPIPKGWRVGKLNDVLAEIETGNRPKGGVGDLEYGVPSIGAENIIGLGQYDYSKEKFISEEYFKSMSKGQIKDWDVLLYKDGAQIGRKSMFAIGFPHKTACVNSHVFLLRSNNLISQSYLYFWLDQENMTQSIINLNANSAQPGINQTALKTLPIIVPKQEILFQFETIIYDCLKLLFTGCIENKNLSTLRDTLLPKIMSGEIRVPFMKVKQCG